MVKRPWVIKGAIDGAAFAAYVEKVLVPKLSPGTVVILDNLATHKNAQAAKAMRKAGCWFLFLPAIQSRSQPDRNGVLQAQSAPAQDRGARIHRHFQCHR
ncbi:MAG: transposase [Loktanella sp.]|nr:transposase [Loktanella sp.]